MYQLRVDPKRTTCFQFKVRTFCSKCCSCERVGKSFRRRYNIYYASWVLPTETKTEVVALLWEAGQGISRKYVELSSCKIHQQPGNNLDHHLSPPSQLERQGRPGRIGSLDHYINRYCVSITPQNFYEMTPSLHQKCQTTDCPQEVLSSIRAPGVDVLHFQLATLSTFQKEWIDRSLDFAMLKVSTWRQRWAKYGKVMLHMFFFVICCMFALLFYDFVNLCDMFSQGKCGKMPKFRTSAPRCGWSTHGPSRCSRGHPGRS